MHKKIFALIVIDQITKLIFSHRDFFLGILHIHLVKNYGLAFSLNLGLLPNLILLGLGLSVFIYFYRKHDWAFVLVMAGALSNIIDRLYLGYVRDFLDLSLGFTFNLADAFVIIGLIIILISQPKSRFDQDF
jgi:signal peptidase II